MLLRKASRFTFDWSQKSRTDSQTAAAKPVALTRRKILISNRMPIAHSLQPSSRDRATDIEVEGDTTLAPAPAPTYGRFRLFGSCTRVSNKQWYVQCEWTIMKYLNVPKSDLASPTQLAELHEATTFQSVLFRSSLDG